MTEVLTAKGSKGALVSARKGEARYADVRAAKVVLAPVRWSGKGRRR